MTITLDSVKLGDTVRLTNGKLIVVESRVTGIDQGKGMVEGEWVSASAFGDRHAIADVVEIVERNLRLCIYCGDGVTSTNPETTFCRGCHYSGRANEGKREALLDILRSIDGVDDVGVWHTGGGCFLLAVNLDDGRLITATEGDAIIPEPGDPWGFVCVSETVEVFEEWDMDRMTILLEEDVPTMTDEALVALVEKVAKGETT